LKSDLDVLAVKREKLLELDYMRVIACFAVMIVHISATGVTEYIHGSFPNIVMTLLNRSFKFTTPIFIFLSGVTGFYGYRNKEFNYFEFIGKRLNKVLIPYLVWCAIYYFVYIRLGYYSFNVKFFLKSIAQGTMSYHLYFVIIIIQLYLLGPIFYNLVKKSKNRIRLLVVSAIITSLFVEYLRFDLSDRVFLKYMFFYMFGMFVTLEHEKFTPWLKKHSILVIMGYILSGLSYTLVSYYNLKIYSFVWFLFSTLSILFVYLVGLISKEKLHKIYGFIKIFGQSSYYIYLMHPIILTTMIIIAADKGILSVTTRLIIYFSVVIPVTVISCLSYTMVKNKIKRFRKKVAASLN
jgi:surface polysaccharide O-acyltransferase-like enzyme